MSAQTRMTKQRKIILEEILKLRSHPTADMLYEIVRRRLPHISLGTVYRNLEFLVSTGAIAKLEVDNIRRFDGAIEPHAHTHCVRCGAICDVPLIESDTVSPSIEGFTILSTHIEYEGVCSECASKANQEENS